MHVGIFLNKKLVTCDTIVPFAMELRRIRPELRIEFFCFDTKTEESIRNNFVLMEAIERLGGLRMLGRRRNGRLAWLAHRLRSVATIATLAARALLGRSVFIHFKALSEWPLRVLYVANRRRTILCEGAVAGYAVNQRRVSALIRPRSEAFRTAAAGALFYFHDDWQALTAPALAGVPRHKLPNPYRLQAWRSYIDARAVDDLRAALKGCGADPAAAPIGFLLGWFGEMGFLEDPHVMPTLFEETLDILIAEANGRAIVLKPHVITDMAVVRDALARRPGAPVVVANLHPSVLASAASMIVANYYSTAMFPAKSIGVPTVEYSRYSAEALEITSGGSMRPDIVSHFINGDADALRRTVRALSERGRQDAALADTTLPPALLDMLFGGRAGAGAPVPAAGT